MRVKGGKRAEKGGKGAKAGATSQLKGFSYLPDKLYEFTLMGEFVKAYPKGLVNDIKFIEQQLKVVSSGVAAATVKGKDYIPHADLALCRHYAQLLGQSGPCDNGSGDVVPFPVVELTLEQALTFLSKDPLVFDNQPNGYLLLTYKGVGLGFVKNLGTRSNNLLPQARRIRMMH